MKRSRRTVLVVGNTVVVVCLLLLFGTVLQSATQTRLQNDIDQDLRRDADHTLRGDPPPGPPPMDEMGGGPNNDRPRRGPRDDIRRPHVFDSNGKSTDSSIVALDPEGLTEALRGRESIRTITVDDHAMRVGTFPTRSGGAVQVSRDAESLIRLAGVQRTMLAWFMPLGALAAAVVSTWLTRRVLSPVQSLTRAAASYQAADMTSRLPVEGEDEFSELASTFNGMLGRVQLAFEDQRRFTADASHEMRTPLARLRLATSRAALEDASIAELREALKTADRAAETLARLLDQLLTLARVDAGQLHLRRESHDLRVVAAEALDSLAEADRVGCVFDDRAINVQVDADQIRRVVINLVENALRHSNPGASVRLKVQQTPLMATISVEDDGEGIPVEHLPRIFDRFYRVGSDRGRASGGSGLGLAICRDLIRAHGGEITIQSIFGKGTLAIVSIPIGPHNSQIKGL